MQVPLEVLPLNGGVPPFSGKGEGAVEVGDAATVRSAQQGMGAGMAAMVLGGDSDLQSGSKALEREAESR